MAKKVKKSTKKQPKKIKLLGVILPPPKEETPKPKRVQAKKVAPSSTSKAKSKKGTKKNA